MSGLPHHRVGWWTSNPTPVVAGWSLHWSATKDGGQSDRSWHWHIVSVNYWDSGWVSIALFICIFWNRWWKHRKFRKKSNSQSIFTLAWIHFWPKKKNKCANWEMETHLPNKLWRDEHWTHMTCSMLAELKGQFQPSWMQFLQTSLDVPNLPSWALPWQPVVLFPCFNLVQSCHGMLLILSSTDVARFIYSNNRTERQPVCISFFFFFIFGNLSKDSFYRLTQNRLTSSICVFKSMTSLCFFSVTMQFTLKILML